MADVVVELGGKEILRIALKGPSMTIGRDPQCDVHLDNRALSRRHAQIEKRGAAIWVRDLNSANGTFVNGGRIHEPQALNGGDVVELGRYQVRIEGADNAAANTPVLTLTGPEGRHRFAMVGEEIIIGRAPSCDIAIGHKGISRRHLRIAIDGETFIAEDLGSQNGTRLNAKKIVGPTPFRIGDKLHMSEFTVEVGYMEEGADADDGGSSKSMMLDRSELAKAAYLEGDGFVGSATRAGNIAVGKASSADDDEESDRLSQKNPVTPARSELEDDDEPVVSSQKSANTVKPKLRPGAADSARPAEPSRALEARGAEARGAEARLPEGRASDHRGPDARGAERHEARTSDHRAADLRAEARVEGRADGRAEGRADGRAEGRADARPEARPDGRISEPARKQRQGTPWVTVSHSDEDDRDIQLTADVTIVAEDGSSDDGSRGRSYADQGYVLLIKTAAGVVATAAGDRRLLVVNGKACLHKALVAGDVMELGFLSVTFHTPG